MTDGNGARALHRRARAAGARASCSRSIRPASPAATSRSACCASSRRARCGDPALACRIVRDHWDLFLRRQFPALAQGARRRRCATSSRRSSIIRALDTHPGRKYSTERAALRRARRDDRQGGRRVRHPAQRRRPAAPPGLQALPPASCSKCAPRSASPKRRQFIKEKMRSAIWLIKSLDQRQRTIYKVAESIVRQQRDFLDRGIDHLQADGPARRGRGHRHARVDGEPRGLQQVHPHAARPLPDEVLLPQRHRPRVRRQHLVADGEAEDPAADPGRGCRAGRSRTAS